MSFLAAAGFDPYGMPDFFETMGRRSPVLATSRNALPEILQSHPVSTNRIAESRARAAQFKELKPTAESVSYTLTRERLRVLATPTEDNVRRYYAERRAQQRQSVGERYGEALASYQAGDARAALDALFDLAREYPQVPMLQSTLGQAIHERGRHRRGAGHVPTRAQPLAAQYSAHAALCGKPHEGRRRQDGARGAARPVQQRRAHTRADPLHGTRGQHRRRHRRRGVTT